MMPLALNLESFNPLSSCSQRKDTSDLDKAIHLHYHFFLFLMNIWRTDAMLSYRISMTDQYSMFKHVYVKYVIHAALLYHLCFQFCHDLRKILNGFYISFLDKDNTLIPQCYKMGHSLSTASM